MLDASASHPSVSFLPCLSFSLSSSNWKLLQDADSIFDATGVDFWNPLDSGETKEAQDELAVLPLPLNLEQGKTSSWS